MSANSKSKKQNLNNEVEADVLYQKIGSKVYAFSMIDDEVFFASVEEENLNIPEVTAEMIDFPAESSGNT